MMILEITLTPEEEARLDALARKKNLTPAKYTEQLLKAQLDSVQSGAATFALFARWEAEDATDDPEEIAARNREFEEFKKNMNEERARAKSRVLFP